MHRLFAALRPPPPTRDLLADTMDGVPHARWQDDDQLHLTTRFIGQLDRTQAEDVAAALAQVTAPPIEARVEGVGRFERRGRTEALWARVAPLEPLAHLHRKVTQALARAGIAPETRAYLPHVTLARLGRRGGDEAAVAAWLARHAGLASPAFTLDHLVLYESRLGHAGATYDAVARWPLTR